MNQPIGPEPLDSPTQWVREHTQRYLETAGEDGYLWRGVPTLLLTTRGRRSGQMRRTALIFGRDGDTYVVVASRGGAPEHPLWYLNLCDSPAVEVQVKDERFRARARPATADERPRLWRLMADIWPAYDEYQTRTPREIPVVVIERE